MYVKTTSINGNYINLIIAKTKVSPIKTETIPRLELCAAVLLSKLIKMVQGSLPLKFHLVRCWTDSTIVLDWLKSNKKLPIFVTNRIRSIKSIISPVQWFHVEGKDNPADAASRGISSIKLLDSQLWLNGPPWLISDSVIPFNEEESTYSTTADESSVSLLINNSSSYIRMKRVFAYCLRFIHNCRNKINQLTGSLTVDELKNALHKIILVVQGESLAEEIQRLQSNLVITSRMKHLSPFLDAAGLVRVGGRLSNSSCCYDQQHPFLLPKNHPFTEVVARHYHLSYLHAGPQLTLSLIRNQFWIVRAPDVVKRIIRQCIVCHRQNSATANQLMGQLPSPRVNLSKPFTHTGMDYAGPFMLCPTPGRNPKIVKHYVSIFVCMATRAVHFELVGDLTTPAFVNALTRFISRRGLPTDLYCDGGKNFVGAKNEMVQFTKLMKSTPHQDTIQNFFSSKEIRYHFNPPLSPHHGGLWEAGVKSMKFHLKRVIESRHLSIEEFLTLLCQVEACLNSRPLTQLSTDPNDFGALTPGHFLTGDSLTVPPQNNVMDININRLSRWQVVQHLFQHFWRRWNSEYLNTLQSRPKWYAPQPNLEVGILVLIRDDEPTWGPLKWKLGRISAVYPGSDGKVRVCDVKTASGAVYKRPISKLSPLPIYN